MLDRLALMGDFVHPQLQNHDHVPDVQLGHLRYLALRDLEPEFAAQLLHMSRYSALTHLVIDLSRGYAAMPRNYTVFAHSLKAHPIAAQITALDLRALACHAGIYSATLDLFFWSWPTLERLSLDFNTLSPGYWRALCSSHQGCVPALRHLYVMEISPLDVQEFVFLRLQVPLPLP